jgi:hypothetical protein
VYQIKTNAYYLMNDAVKKLCTFIFKINEPQAPAKTHLTHSIEPNVKSLANKRLQMQLFQNKMPPGVTYQVVIMLNEIQLILKDTPEEGEIYEKYYHIPWTEHLEKTHPVPTKENLSVNSQLS